MITEGWSEDYIEFECKSNYFCRVDIWGFAYVEKKNLAVNQKFNLINIANSVMDKEGGMSTFTVYMYKLAH